MCAGTHYKIYKCLRREIYNLIKIERIYQFRGADGEKNLLKFGLASKVQGHEHNYCIFIPIQNVLNL